MINGWDGLGSLYIHWPFCPYRCSFCSFVALAEHDQYMKRYHEALCLEIDHFLDFFESKLPIRTIFLGGGTPSTWPDDLLLDMFVKLKDVFLLDNEPEVTIEVNPGTVRSEQLQLWKKVGINRLSIGVQSLNNEVLSRLNRHQTKDDVYSLLHYASCVFDNISVDLMVGLPGVAFHEWRMLLEEVVKWPIVHVSVYCLTIHEKTKLYYQCQKDEISVPNDDEVAKMYEVAIQILGHHGLEQYEVSNFARPGYESRHNNVYWNYQKYKGFGLGACSFDGQVRSQNMQNFMEYIIEAENKRTVAMFQEHLTEDQKRLEKIMLGLRTKRGVNCDQIIDGLSPDEKECCKKHIGWLKQNNFMAEHDGRLCLTSKGLVVEHEIVARFFSGKN